MFDPLSSAGRDVITVADLVRTGTGRTRQQLARATGMGRNTVSTLLNTAVELGLVCPDGAGPSTGGRAPETWRFRHEEGLVLVTGVHTSTLHLAVTDLAGTPVNRLILAWPISRGPTATLAKAAEQLRDMAAPLEQAVWAAGVSLPGPIDQETGRPTAPPIMPGWDGFDVVGAMTGALGVPAVAANDVNTMLLGYATDLPDRTERRLQDVLYVQVGTGIGAGLMSHGVLHWGADGAAGDIGHVRVSGSDAVVCRCGRTGCLEAVAGPARRPARRGRGDQPVPARAPGVGRRPDDRRRRRRGRGRRHRVRDPHGAFGDGGGRRAGHDRQLLQSGPRHPGRPHAAGLRHVPPGGAPDRQRAGPRPGHEAPAGGSAGPRRGG